MQIFSCSCLNLFIPSILSFSVILVLCSRADFIHCNALNCILIWNYMQATSASIGSDNGLSPVQHEAIIWTNAGIFFKWTIGKKLQWNFNHNSNIFIQENAFEKVICQIEPILSLPQWVKMQFFFFEDHTHMVEFAVPGGHFKNAYEFLTLRTLKISIFHKNFIFQCMGKIFCVEFQRYPLKFHTKHLTHTLKDVYFMHRWKFKSS